MKQIAFIVLAYFFLEPSPHAMTTSAWAKLEKAENAYSQADFATAKDLYLAAFKENAALGEVNGHLLYNLGNCYYRLQEYGKALLYFERAKILIPNDRDLNANIEIVLQQLKIVGSASHIFSEKLLFWNHFFSLPTLWQLLLLIHALLLLLLASIFFAPRGGKLRHRSQQLLWMVISIELVLILSFLSKALDHRVRRGLITSEEVVRSGAGNEFIPVIKLPAGSMVTVLERGQQWWKIAVAAAAQDGSDDQLKGYVEAGKIDEIGAWQLVSGRHLHRLLAEADNPSRIDRPSTQPLQ